MTRRRSVPRTPRRQPQPDPLMSSLQQAKLRIEMQAKALEQANQQLKESAALKDEFVAKVSHELRTPLTSIKEGLSLLLDGALGPTTPDQRDFVQTMEGDIDRLAELINNVLDISKIEAGRMRLMRVSLDVRPLIESIIRSYQPILGRRQVRTDFGSDRPVLADPHRLRQVLVNLFSNALKFTGDEGTIVFRTRTEAGMVAVAVEDDGLGIAPEDLPKLFEKFSQVGPQGNGQPRGTGLGLAVCKELTELHHGRIAASSVLGRGAAFTVHLPVYSDALALEEGLQELRRAVGPGGVVGFVAMDVAALCGRGDGRMALDALLERVHANLHRDDLALALAPSRIVLLTLTDIAGMRAVAARLRKALPGGDRVVFGGALHAGDATTAAVLFERAASADGRALLAETQP